MATFFGMLLIIAAAAVILFFLVGAIVEEDATIFLMGMLLSLIPLVPGICLLTPDDDSSKSVKVEQVEIVKTDSIECITTEFLNAEGFYGISGQYELGGGIKYDILDEAIYVNVESGFEYQKLILFDNIRYIRQLQEFYKLRGEDRDFSKYLNSN